jgi:hypothetical protein
LENAGIHMQAADCRPKALPRLGSGVRFASPAPIYPKKNNILTFFDVSGILGFFTW